MTKFTAQIVEALNPFRNNHQNEKVVNEYYSNGLGISARSLEIIIESRQFDRILEQMREAKTQGTLISWTVLANVCAIANRLVGHRIRFGVGLSGGYASSEDQFIFTTWGQEFESDVLDFEAPEIQRWIRLVVRLVLSIDKGVEPVNDKRWYKELDRIQLNKATKADCIECRLQSVGTKYVLLCHGHQSPPVGAKIMPPNYWESWDTSNYNTQVAWTMTRSIQNYIHTGRKTDPDIRQFLIVQGQPSAGKTQYMSALDRLFKSMGLNGGNLPNSNVFSNMEFASSNYALIDDADIATGKNRSVNVLFTSAVIKSMVSGTASTPYSMKNSTASVPIKNKMLVMQNTNFVNLADLVNCDAGNLDRMRLLHVDRITLNHMFDLYGIEVDRKDIPGSYDKLVATMLWSPLLPPEPGLFCRFDPERYDLGQLLTLVIGSDPSMTIFTALRTVLERYPDHYRVRQGEEHKTLFDKLHPVTGDTNLDFVKCLDPLQALLARDPDYPVVLRQSASTWFALFKWISEHLAASEAKTQKLEALT